MNSHVGGHDKGDPEWGLILDATPMFISIHDANYRIVKANTALKKLLQKTSTPIIGRRCYEVIHGKPQPPVHCPHSRAMETRSHQRQEFFEPRLGMRIALSCHPLFGPDGRVIGSIHLASEAGGPVPSDAILTKNLIDRQKQILGLLCKGQTIKEIAAQLSVSPRTVEYHKRRMMNMFSVRSMAELIARVVARDPSFVE